MIGKLEWATEEQKCPKCEGVGYITDAHRDELYAAVFVVVGSLIVPVLVVIFLYSSTFVMIVASIVAVVLIVAMKWIVNSKLKECRLCGYKKEGGFKVPRIFRYAIWGAYTVLIWKLVANIEEIALYVVNLIAK